MIKHQFLYKIKNRRIQWNNRTQLMDIEKPTQRKTVQWNAQEIKANVIDHHQDFRKKVLQFEVQKSSMENDDSDSSSSDGEVLQEKSEKTIEIQTNLKKANVNRISLKPGKPINLKEINRRISSIKENTHMEEEDQVDEVSMAKKLQFQKKKAKLCNQSFPLKKKN